LGARTNIMSVSNPRAEDAVRRIMMSEGYKVSSPRARGETGVDLIATRGEERIHIEVIGYSDKPPKRALDFFQAFFRAVSRLKDGATSCVIALPKEYQRGLPQRVAQYGPAWNRLGLPSEPGRGFFQDLPLLAELAILAAQPTQLVTLRGRQAIAAQALVQIDLSTQLRIDWAVGSNSRDSSSGVRPERTNSTIRRRYSGGYGGRLLGIADSFLPKDEVSTESGQLHRFGNYPWPLA